MMRSNRCQWQQTSTASRSFAVETYWMKVKPLVCSQSPTEATLSTCCWRDIVPYILQKMLLLLISLAVQQLIRLWKVLRNNYIMCMGPVTKRYKQKLQPLLKHNMPTDCQHCIVIRGRWFFEHEELAIIALRIPYQQHLKMYNVEWVRRINKKFKFDHQYQKHLERQYNQRQWV